MDLEAQSFLSLANSRVRSSIVRPKTATSTVLSKQKPNKLVQTGGEGLSQHQSKLLPERRLLDWPEL